MTEKLLRNVASPRDASSPSTQKLSNHEDGGYHRSRVIKRSIVVGGHKTSVSLEDVFWQEFRQIADDHGLHLSQLVARIDAERRHGNLSSAIRLFVFEQRCKGAETRPYDGHHASMT